MKNIHAVFFKTIVSTFYQRHAGMFLVFILLMFGVVPPQNLWSYHQKLLEAFLGDSILRTIVYFFWFVYALKCVQFVLQQFEKPECSFLFEINAVPFTKRFTAALITMIWLFMPVLSYAVIAVGYGFNSLQFVLGLEVLLVCTTLLFFISFIIDRKISKKNDAGLSKLLHFLSLRFRKSYITVVFMHLLNDLKMVFSVTKFLSIVCIYISFAFCDKDVYDIRVIMLGLLFAMLAHATLLFEIRKFEETQLLFMRNAPQSIFEKWLNYFALVTIILLPEFLLLINVVNEKIIIEQLPVLILFSIAMLLSFTSSLYKLPFNKDKSIIYPTYIVLVVFFLILYKLFAVIIGGLFLFSFFMLYKNYFRFELVEEK